MVELASPIDALVEHIDMDTDVTTLAHGRVYAHEIPPKIVPQMPLQAVLVRAVGGGDRFEPSYIPLASPRVDVKCFGKTPTAASALSDAVEWVLSGIKGVNESGTRLLSAECEMSGTFMRDPDRDWPYVMSTWRVVLPKLVAA